MSDDRIVIPSDYPDALRRIMDLADQVLREKFDVDPERATRAGYAIAERLRHEFGGTEVYFCKGTKMELVDRDLEIYRAHTGRRQDIDALAIKYNLTSVRIRQIINACHRADMAAKQPPLF